MAGNRQHQQGQGKQFFLDLDVPKEVKVGEIFYAKTLVSRPGHKLPDRAVQIQHYTIGIAFKHPVETENETGVASIGMSFDSPGQKSVQSQIVGTPYVSQVRHVNVLGESEKKSDPKTVVDKVLPRGVGSRGKYTITVSVADNQNRPIEAEVNILDVHTGRIIFTAMTNKHGQVPNPLKVRFTQRFREYEVQCGLVSQRLVLEGPGTKKLSAPHPTNNQLRGSLWEVFKRGWRGE